jgi:penicillin-binding protein 1A
LRPSVEGYICLHDDRPEAMSAPPRSRTDPRGPSRPRLEDVWVASPPPPRIARGRRIAGIVLLSIALASVSVSGSLVALYATTDLPAIPPLPETSLLLDRTGRPIAKLHAGIDRTLIDLDRMPVRLRRAVVAVEDADFYRHDGLDLSAVLRATWEDVKSGSLSQGGSTITQQYVKNVLTGPEHSISRKVREAILALKLERTTSKDEILEGYLNTVYFGHGAYGVQAAARTYFDVDAEDLSLVQSATLAGLIAAPSARDPFRHPETALRYRNFVVDRMVAVGALEPSTARRVHAAPLGLTEERRVRSPAAHFLEYVRRGLMASYGPDAIYRGGLKVRTTLDMDWQRAAERAVRAYLPRRVDPEAAVVAIDPRTGAIRAMVAGRSFARSEFNLATQGRRQAGSAFKPFVLLAALEQGISPLELRTGPSRLTIPDPFCETKGEPWEVSNAGDQAAGTMSLENAMAGSVNTIFAQVTVQVGPESVADVARRMGIRSRLSPVCSIGLGTSEVTPLDMTSAFATLAARGIYVEPTAVERVTGAGGTVLQGPLRGLRSVGSMAVSAQDADATTRVLQGVIDHGTGTAARLAGRSAAGKTGTAENATDAWFCGYVPQLATCVWIGYPKTNRPMHDVAGFHDVYGGTVPALIWHDFMAEVTDGMPVAGFAPVSFDIYEDPPPPAVPAPDPSEAPPAPSSSPEPSPSPSPSPTPSPSPSPKPSPKPSPSQTPSPSSGAGDGSGAATSPATAPRSRDP